MKAAPGSVVMWKGHRRDERPIAARPLTQIRNGSRWEGTETLIACCDGTVAKQRKIEMSGSALAGFPNSLIGNGQLVKVI
jgi:hypothetical protein